MRFLLNVNGKDLVLTDRQLHDVMGLLDKCEEMKQVYKGDGKGTRGTGNQYADEITPLDPRGAFDVKPLSDTYYDTLKLVAKLNP